LVLPKVILTTHAYLKKRGDSSFLDIFHLDLIWLATEHKLGLNLIVDEAHLFLDSLYWSLKIKGLYKPQYNMGGASYDIPVTNVKNLSNLDGETLQSFKKRKTKHTYYISNQSKNPTIGWDRGSLSRTTRIFIP